MKRILLSLLVLMVGFVAQGQIFNATPYCTNNYDINYNGVNYLKVGTYTHNFGAVGDASNPNAHTYYNTTVLPALQVGVSTPITINFYSTQDCDPMYFALLIDLNQDQVFDPVTESVVNNGNTIGGPLPCGSSTAVTVNYNLNLPLGTIGGSTRMRLVRYSDFFGATPLIYDPTMTYFDCYSGGFSNFTYGCTYDFDINIHAPTLVATPATLSAYSTIVGTPSANQQFTVSGTYLLGNVTLNAPAMFEISTQAATGFGPSVTLTPTSGTLANTTIYARYNPTSAGSHSGNIAISSLGAQDQYVTVTGTSTAPIIPTLTATPTTLTAFTAYVGYPSAPQTYTISGVYLAGNVNISAPVNFEISLTAGSGYGSSIVLTPVAQTVPATTIYVRYNPLGVGTHSGVVSNWSTNSNQIDIPVNGTASAPPPPTVTVTPNTLANFNTIVGIPSATQSISVSGTYLMGDINLDLPAPFEISTSASGPFSQSIVLTPIGGMVGATTIYVRFNPSIPNTYTGNLTIASLNTTSTIIPLNGIGTPNTPVLSLSPTSLNYFITTFGIPSATQVVTVGGNYLVAPLAITAPQQWQVSTMASSGFGSYIQLQPDLTGYVPLTTIYVRYNPSVPGNHQGTLVVSSTGAVSKSILMNGFAYPTSVSNLSDESSFIYPTTSSDLVFISPSLKGCHIHLYDFTGRMVLEYQHVEDVFSIRNLYNGHYLLDIQSGDLHYSSRLIKE